LCKDRDSRPGIDADLYKIAPKDGATIGTVGRGLAFDPIHAAVFNTCHVQRHLTSTSTHRTFRASAMGAWRAAAVSARKQDDVGPLRSAFAKLTAPS
jgi:hypothetical protein